MLGPILGHFTMVWQTSLDLLDGPPQLRASSISTIFVCPLIPSPYIQYLATTVVLNYRKYHRSALKSY